MGDIEADLGHAFDHRSRRRCTSHHATYLVRYALAKFGGGVDDEVVHDGAAQ
jgi:hypothetical protein